MENEEWKILGFGYATLTFLGGKKLCDSAIINSQLSMLNYLELQVTTASNQHVASGHHARFIAG